MEESIDLDLTLDPNLPVHLRDAPPHLHCPNLRVVYVRLHNQPRKPVVFRGVVRETGWIAVSLIREHGYDPTIHFVESAKIHPCQEEN